MADNEVALLYSLPIETLVAAPLISAARAQIMLSQEFANYIQSVGLNKDGNIRMMPFIFDAPTIGDDGKTTGDTRECKIQVPFIALTGVPNFGIEELTVDFSIKIAVSEQMELKGTQSPDRKESQQVTSLAEMRGNISPSGANIRKSDTEGRYSFKLTAKKQEPPEALMKILDMLTETTVKLSDAHTGKNKAGRSNSHAG